MNKHSVSSASELALLMLGTGERVLKKQRIVAIVPQGGKDDFNIFQILLQMSDILKDYSREPRRGQSRSLSFLSVESVLGI